MNKKFDRLNMRILATDKFALQKIAKSEGETMSVVIRRLIKQELEKNENKENQENNV